MECPNQDIISKFWTWFIISYSLSEQLGPASGWTPTWLNGLGPSHSSFFLLLTSPAFLLIIFCLDSGQKREAEHTMQTPLCEMLSWMNHQLKSGLPRGISTASDMHMIPPNGTKWRGTKEPLGKGEKGEWKTGLKLNF